MIRSLYRSVLKEANASSERSQIMMGVMTGAVFSPPDKKTPSMMRLQVSRAFRAEPPGPMGIRKALWSVKQLRDLKAAEAPKVRKERTTMLDAMPFTSEFKGGTSAIQTKEVEGMTFVFQGKCVTQADDGSYKYRVCLQSMLGPKPVPDTATTLDQFHLFVLDPEGQTMRKVLNCGPLGQPFLHTLETPESHFECTVSSPARQPVIRALVSVNQIDKKTSTFVMLGPIVLDPVSLKYPLKVGKHDF